MRRKKRINMKQTTKGTIAMILTALLWSIGGIFIKLVPWNPLAIASTTLDNVRSFLAGSKNGNEVE